VVVPDLSGGFNGSTQHSARTHSASKTEAKSAGWVISAGASSWLRFRRVSQTGRFFKGTYRRIYRLDDVASTD
jgi:hypothetical protein